MPKHIRAPQVIWNCIATLNASSTSYYDTRYTVGQGALAWYKVCKRNVNRLSQFSNIVSINIIPQSIVDNNYELRNTSDSEYSESQNALYQNYPNPFNPSTIITFGLRKPGFVTIILYNVLGEEVTEIARGFFSKGIHKINFNATSLAAGIYFYTLNTNEFSMKRKLILLK